MLPISRKIINKGYKYTYSNFYKLFEKIKPNKIIKIPINNKSCDEFDTEFTDWFNRLELHSNLLNKPNRSIIKFKNIYEYTNPWNFDFYYYISLYLYYKFANSIKETGLDIYSTNNPGRLCKIYENSFTLTWKDKELICASFITAAVGCLYYYDAFNMDWILKPNGAANQNYRNIINMHFMYILNDAFSGSNIINECMMIQILLYILDDQYDYMYKQYFKKVKALGKCEAYNIHKNLTVPEYYVTYKRGYKYYKIFRYDKEQNFI